jgi:hypothetical protein
MLPLLSAALVLAVAAEPDPTKRPQPPAVHFHGFTDTGALQFAVTNPNRVPLPYVGYTNDSIVPRSPDEVIHPAYRIELCRNQVWQLKDARWCKSGMGPVTVPASGTVTFRLLVPEGEWDEIRVGLMWVPSGEHKGERAIAWGPAISRTDATPKRAP